MQAMHVVSNGQGHNLPSSTDMRLFMQRFAYSILPLPASRIATWLKAFTKTLRSFNRISVHVFRMFKF